MSLLNLFHKDNNLLEDIAIATYPFMNSFRDVFDQQINIIGHPNFFNENAFKLAKLIIFSGGEDINPAIYGKKNTHSHFSLLRDQVELEVLERSLKENKKIFGVCRGHQLINAFLGGDLIQDLFLDLKIDHESYHPLEIENENYLTPKFFDSVNSMHHQGVIKEGKNLIPTSFYKGIIESCESENIITVQFHPEFMGRQSKEFFSYLKNWKDKGKEN